MKLYSPVCSVISLRIMDMYVRTDSFILIKYEVVGIVISFLHVNMQ